jgi:hypothetical protein
MDERAELVSSYCAAGGLAVADVVRDRPGDDPFVAVIARPDRDVSPGDAADP